MPKEISKEDKAKKIKEVEEKMAKERETNLANLDSPLWMYASPKLVTSEGYGNLSKVSEVFYKDLISHAPDQHVYEKLFLPQLIKEGGAVTTPYIQETSKKILEESFKGIKVEDALKYSGLEGQKIKEGLKDKYLGMFQDKNGNNPLVEMLMNYKTNELASIMLGYSNKSLSGELENILVDKPKENKPEGQ